MTRLAVLLLFAACASTPPPAPGTPSSAALEHPTGPQALVKGASHDVEINARETHEWFIDLAAGEHVTFDIAATSTGTPMCTNWSWAFYNTRGDTLREQPRGPSDGGSWQDTIEGVAQPSAVEDPAAGRYLVRVMADVACPRLRYTLAAR